MIHEYWNLREKVNSFSRFPPPGPLMPERAAGGTNKHGGLAPFFLPVCAGRVASGAAKTGDPKAARPVRATGFTPCIPST
jgi:hypothetical protein